MPDEITELKKLIKDQNELFYARGEIWKKVAAQLGCFSDPDYLAFITAVLNSHSQKITLN